MWMRIPWKSLINETKFFKNREKINLYLSNTFQLYTVLATGLSYFHLLTVRIWNGFTKFKSHVITYREYKEFDNNTFRYEIQSFCSSEADLGFFKESIFHIFNKHGPIKKNYLRANEANLMTRELHVAIMKRSRPRNKFLKRKISKSV